MGVKKGQLKVTFTIDWNAPGGEEQFANLIQMMINGGYREEVKKLAQELVAEAKKRNLPCVQEMGL